MELSTSIHTFPMPNPESDQHHHTIHQRDLPVKGGRTRTRIKSGRAVPDGAVMGTVLMAAGPDWWVEPLSLDGRGLGLASVLCSVSGVLDAPADRTLVVVGDRVWYIPEATTTEPGQQKGVIIRVDDRTTILSRRAAGRAQREQVLVANVDQLAIVIAAAQPDYHRRLIDRYLIAADKGDLEPLIIVNKVDLVSGDLLAVIVEDLLVYADDLHLDVFFVSTVTKAGIAELLSRLSGKCTLIAGQSGVGKTSMINLLTQNQFRVGEISRQYQKGRHTTTGATVIPLPGGGSVVDSPGIREFALWQLGADELQYYFVEFAPHAPNCKFASCTHTHEPGCAVKQAVDDGTVEEGRYNSYTILLEEVSNRE